MTMEVSKMLDQLPPYQDNWLLIHPDQTVPDIITEVLDAHKEFEPYYDKISSFFEGGNVEKICDRIFCFLKENVKYKEESKDDQTSALPTGILIRGRGDCKHYSGFTAGVLDALKRKGHEINWCYRFASYKLFDTTPHHVFVVVNPGSANELWIDPTPEANKMEPAWMLDKKIKAMAIRRNISGIGNSDTELVDIDIAPDMDFGKDEDLTPEFIAAIELLLYYGILDDRGNINDTRLIALASEMPEGEYRILTNAWQSVMGAKVSGFFQDIWRGVKKVSLAIPRNAYLSLVALNVFGTATKLKQAISRPEDEKKISDKWYSLGGTYDKLKNAINGGSKKKRIFGPETLGAAPVLPPWVAIAAALIAAMTPLINSILNKQKMDQIPYVEGYDPSLINMTTAYGSTDPMTWIKENPILVAGGAVMLYLLIKRPRGRAA